MTAPPRRAGFTLLELIIAMSIGMLLLAGLYMALHVQLNQMLSGREIIQQSAIARALLTRISNDIGAQLGPVDPRVVSAEAIQDAASSGATQESENADKGEEENSSDSSKTDSDADKSTTSSDKSSDMASSSESVPADSSGTAHFNFGIRGDSTSLHLHISQGPKDADRNAAGTLSDLRRVSYWLAGDLDLPLGLARYEAKLATSADGLGTQVPSDPTPYIISDQVTNLMFEYFDGMVWQPTWDGAALMADGKTPLGPPAAVAITLTIAAPQVRPGMPRQSTIRHVVFLPASNGVDLGLGGLTP